MTDFSVAFKKGQEAALAADVSRKEIDTVFNEVRKQLLAATDGSIEIIRQERIKKNDPYVIKLFSPAEKYWSIDAINPKSDPSELITKELAMWEQAQSGYPCKISLGGTDSICHDKESLENALNWLLSDVRTAEKLRILISSQHQEQNKTSE